MESWVDIQKQCNRLIVVFEDEKRKIRKLNEGWWIFTRSGRQLWPDGQRYFAVANENSKGPSNNQRNIKEKVNELGMVAINHTNGIGDCNTRNMDIEIFPYSERLARLNDRAQ